MTLCSPKTSTLSYDSNLQTVPLIVSFLVSLVVPRIPTPTLAATRYSYGNACSNRNNPYSTVALIVNTCSILCSKPYSLLVTLIVPKSDKLSQLSESLHPFRLQYREPCAPASCALKPVTLPLNSNLHKSKPVLPKLGLRAAAWRWAWTPGKKKLAKKGTGIRLMDKILHYP